MASRVCMLPKVSSVVMITPMVWKRPLFSERAAPFGRYPRACMALITRSRVRSSTLLRPFDTRDTVWDDTPARRATSAIDGRPELDGLGLCRPLPDRLRVRTGGPDRVRALPQPVPGPADRRQRVRRAVQLPAGPDRSPVLGLGAARRGLPRRAGADHAGAGAVRCPGTGQCPAAL